MAMVKKGDSENHIIRGLIVISDAFKKVDITGDNVLDTMQAVDFIHYFDAVRDFRSPDMITYKLSNILMMVFLTILSDGINSFYGIADQVRICRDKYEKYGLIEDGKIPSHDTFRRVFSMLSVQELYNQTIQCFYDFLKNLEDTITGRNSYKQLMIDGKEVRGSGRSSSCSSPKKNFNVLNVYDSSLETCIYSKVIPDKTNEIPVAQDFLRKTILKNVVVTSDALHCQRETADIIAKGKGIYVLTVKDNQKLLLEEMQSLFEKHKEKIITIDRSKRTFEILFLPKSYGWDGFTGMKVFIRMRSKTRSSKREEIRYFISNTTKEELICEAIENRWHIENGLHREKDMFLNEDLFRSSESNTVNCLAVMNNFAMQLIRIYQAVSGLELRHAKIYMRNYTLEGCTEILSKLKSEEVIAKIKEEMPKIKKLKLN